MKIRPATIFCSWGLVSLLGFVPVQSDTPVRLESSFRSSHRLTAPVLEGKASEAIVLRQITGAAPCDIGQRLGLVNELEDNLKPEAIVVLYDFLKSTPKSGEINLTGLRVLKNDLLNVLRNQIVAPEHLTDVLIEIFHDKNQDGVIRDYAIQHLVCWYQQEGIQSLQTKETIVQVLGEALGGGGSIAGTALLGLHRLSALDSLVNYHEINEQALNLALSDQTHLATRITAIQVCGERNLGDALPMIQLVAQSTEHTSLRLSAIAALGYLGGSEQIAVLQKLNLDGKESTQKAIRSALTRLSQKQNLY